MRHIPSALVFLALCGCASNPDKIAATYVSPLKYKDHDCDQVGMEMENVSQRTASLYHQLKKERNADNWQTGVGLVLFWPALFFLEGGDGPEAAEYAQLKGEFTALQDVSVEKKCGIVAKSPDEIIKETEAEEKAKLEAAEEANPLK
jgi:hypothetical protein